MVESQAEAGTGGLLRQSRSEEPPLCCPGPGPPDPSRDGCSCSYRTAVTPLRAIRSCACRGTSTFLLADTVASESAVTGPGPLARMSAAVGPGARSGRPDSNQVRRRGPAHASGGEVLLHSPERACHLVARHADVWTRPGRGLPTRQATLWLVVAAPRARPGVGGSNWPGHAVARDDGSPGTALARVNGRPATRWPWCARIHSTRRCDETLSRGSPAGCPRCGS